MATNGLISRRVWSEDLSSAMNSQHEAHVLAVDDSFVDRKVIERLLKISSCKVTAVDSGRRALEFLGLDDEERHSSAVDGLKVDLIITDYCMPGMTGYELLKKIKESSTFRETPVVIMSSENVVARIDRCLEEGAEDFIVKPVKLADVKKLKDYMMMREDKFKDGMDIIGTSGGEIEIGATPGMNKRKSRDDSSEFSSLAAAEAPVTLVQTAPLLSSPTPSESPSLSSDSILSRSSSSSDSLFSQTPLSMTSSSADSPSSPVTSPSEVLDYPTRKIKLIVSDEHEIAPDSKL